MTLAPNMLPFLDLRGKLNEHKHENLKFSYCGVFPGIRTDRLLTTAVFLKKECQTGTLQMLNIRQTRTCKAQWNEFKHAKQNWVIAHSENRQSNFVKI